MAKPTEFNAEIIASFDKIEAILNAPSDLSDARPGEISAEMFAERSGLSKAASRAKLGRLVSGGHLVRRMGKAKSGRRCSYYSPHE